MRQAMTSPSDPVHLWVPQGTVAGRHCGISLAQPSLQPGAL